MNNILVDVTDLNGTHIQIGHEVELFGKLIPLLQLANWTNMSPTDIALFVGKARNDMKEPYG